METKKSTKFPRFALCLLLVVACVIGLRDCDSQSSSPDPTVRTTQTFSEIQTDPVNPQDWETPMLYYAQTSDEGSDSAVQTPYTNWYDRSKNIGTCTELTGHVLLYFVFVSEPEFNWSEGQKAHLRTTADEDIRKLENEAASEGVSLVVSKTETDVFCQRTLAWNDSNLSDTCDYVMSLLLSNSGNTTYSSMYQNLLKSNGVDSAAFLLFSLADGRAYAHTDPGNSSDHCEHAVCFGDEGTGCLHEILHLYGAIDYYYPEKVRVAAKQIFIESVMLNRGKIDDFTKYLIGWDQTLSETAQSFLNAVSSITKEEVYQAAAQEWEADYIERNYDDGAVYMGPIHKGRQNGYGKMIYADGNVYEGSFVNGQYSEQGKLTFHNGDVYEGSFVNGQYSGQGKLTFHNGDVYEGAFTNSRFDGYGKMVYHDGAVYKGYYSNGQYSGQGTLTYANGNIYQGSFANGQCSGQGRLTYSSGDVYQGSFANGLCNGQGTLTYANGNIYQGSFANGQCSGQGRLTYSSGDVYQGSFANGLCNGQGTLTYTNGNIYQGSFANGQRSGQGRLTFFNGDVYEGNFADGQFSGLGRYTYSDGTAYEGSFSNGKFNGYGKLTYRNGSVFEGYFVNNNPVR